MLLSSTDPLSYGQAMRSGKREGWEKAMQEEIAALEANDVWTIKRQTTGTHALHTNLLLKMRLVQRATNERYSLVISSATI